MCEVTLLGVSVNSALTMDLHVTEVIRSCIAIVHVHCDSIVTITADTRHR